jgi:hypothetical protein
LLFRGGEIIRKVPQEQLESVLIEEVEALVKARRAEREKTLLLPSLDQEAGTSAAGIGVV